MARAVWTGSLSFGLVNVPVALFTATEEKSIRFNQFQAGTADRVRNKRVNERTGEEVAYQDIAKGYDLGGGEYVVLGPEEIASVAPGRSKTMDVSAFVDLAEIDPAYFDRTYYLAPPGKGGGAGKGAERAYALLREAMLRANKVALATFVLREKQYLVAVRPRADVLVAETLLYADEVRDPVAEIESLPIEADGSPRELEMATMLIDSMTTAWDPEQYHDTYRERLEGLIDQKRSGAVVSVAAQEPEGAPVVDLLQALEASLSATRGRASDSTGSSRGPAAKRAAKAPGGARKAAPAKKRAPQKKTAEKKVAAARRKAS
ncbi:MAG: Ku protein [Acidimicrobiales bacterium]